MGQYYKPINIENGQWLCSHDYGNGLKLMEHSWIGNKYVGAVMKLMCEGGPWHKKPIVWCGDYYDEPGEDDYYDKVSDSDKIMPKQYLSEQEQLKAVLVNHSRREYVVYVQIPKDCDHWRINPLPLLTALGNGRGGGDYCERFPDSDKVGMWAKDVLSIEFEIPADFKRLEVNFKEIAERRLCF